MKHEPVHFPNPACLPAESQWVIVPACEVWQYSKHYCLEITRLWCPEFLLEYGYTARLTEVLAIPLKRASTPSLLPEPRAVIRCLEGHHSWSSTFVGFLLVLFFPYMSGRITSQSNKIRKVIKKVVCVLHAQDTLLYYWKTIQQVSSMRVIVNCI